MAKKFQIAILVVFLLFVGVSLAGYRILKGLFNPPDFAELRQKVEVNIKLANGEPSTRWVGPKAGGWAPLSQISDYVVSAIISSEDSTFFSHQGVDVYEMKQAIKHDLEQGRFARGASTITQQVIKNTFLTNEKTVSRKILEILWATKMERVLKKSEILNFYLNLVEFGPGIYGIKAASSHYFSISPSEISAKKAAFLAMLLPSPVRYHTYFERKSLTPWASKRVNHILLVMSRLGHIDDNIYQTALHESLWGETPNADEAVDAPEVEGDLDLVPKMQSVPTKNPKLKTPEIADSDDKDPTTTATPKSEESESSSGEESQSPPSSDSSF